MLILCTQYLTPDEKAQVQSAAPDARIESTHEVADMLRLAEDAEVLFAGHFNAEVMAAAPKLKWVQVGSAGVEGYLFPEWLDSDVILTSSSGVFDKPIAETMLAMMFAFTRRLHLYRDRQREKKWDRSPQMYDLEGKTLGVVGLGAIGYELAQKVQSLGMRVIGIKRSVPNRPPKGVEWVGGLDRILDLAKESDHMAVTLPNTPATRHAINREVLAVMKPTAYLYNIGRGITLEQEALIEALQNGQIAGAGLDVTTPEPLPADHPLWSLENVILTPHVSGLSPRTRERQIAHFADNLRRYVAGEPLKSVVDREAGY
jgi:phosphoglycerate dehydrogenase-like enzyme